MKDFLRRFAADEDPTRPTPSEAYGWRIYITTTCAALGAAMAGYDNAYIGGTVALPSFQKSFGINPSTANLSSNIVSALIAGCVVGSLFAYVIAERWGRRIGLLFSSIVALVGSVLQIVAQGQIGLLYAGRAVTGIGIGVIATVVPIYISEVAPASIRGRLIGVADLFVMFAQVIGYWINYAVKIHMKDSDTQWRIPVAIQLIAPGILILAMPTMVESPRWLTAVGRHNQASKSLAWIRHLPEEHDYVQWELGEMRTQTEKDGSLASGGWKAIRTMWKELNKRGMQRRLVLSCASKIMHSHTGVAALTLYSPLIFKSMGFNKPEDDLLLTGVYGAVKVIATSIFLLFFIDTWGRRKTLYIGSIIIVACLFYIGAFTQISNSFDNDGSPDAAAYCALVVVYLYTAAYAFSWAVYPVIFTSEIFPTRLRALAMTIVSLVQWTMHFVVAYSIPYMVKDIEAGTFYYFGACTVFSTIMVILFYPETKGFPLEKMDFIFTRTRWAIPARRGAEQLWAAERRLAERKGEDCVAGRELERRDQKEPVMAEQIFGGTVDL